MTLRGDLWPETSVTVHHSSHLGQLTPPPQASLDARWTLTSDHAVVERQREWSASDNPVQNEHECGVAIAIFLPMPPTPGDVFSQPTQSLPVQVSWGLGAASPAP